MGRLGRWAWLVGGLLAACAPARDGRPGDEDTGAAVDVARVDALDAGDERDASDAMVDRPTSGPWAPYGLLTLNLHCLRLDGTSFRSNEDRFRAVAAAVMTEDVRAIALQEACERGPVSSVEMLASALEAATGERWSRAWTPAHTAWEGTPDEALEGLGILVRGALDPASVHVHRYRVQSGLTRVMLGATLPPSLGGARLYSVHLSYEDPVAREAQSRETASVALSAAHPSLDVLVAGDFNAVRGTPAHDALSRWGYRDLTAALPGARIDHVWAHAGAAVAGSDAAVVFDGKRHPRVSDHPGYLVRLSPATAEPVARTVLVARATVAEGRVLTVRGDAAPLDWTRGWTAHRVDGGTWRLVATTLPERRFELKWLEDDTRWQAGANVAAQGGRETTATPTF